MTCHCRSRLACALHRRLGPLHGRCAAATATAAASTRRDDREGSRSALRPDQSLKRIGAARSTPAFPTRWLGSSDPMLGDTQTAGLPRRWRRRQPRDGHIPRRWRRRRRRAEEEEEETLPRGARGEATRTRTLPRRQRLLLAAVVVVVLLLLAVVEELWRRKRSGGEARLSASSRRPPVLGSCKRASVTTPVTRTPRSRRTLWPPETAETWRIGHSVRTFDAAAAEAETRAGEGRERRWWRRMPRGLDGRREARRARPPAPERTNRWTTAASRRRPLPSRPQARGERRRLLGQLELIGLSRLATAPSVPTPSVLADTFFASDGRSSSSACLLSAARPGCAGRKERTG